MDSNNNFLKSNSAGYRLLRTVVQGIIGVLIAYLDVLIGLFTIPDTMRPFVVAIVMAILSPIMKALGGKDEN